MPSYRVRNKAGDERATSQLEAAAADGYLPVVIGPEGDERRAKDLTAAASDGYKPKLNISKLESGARGGAQGLTLGYSDELAGAGAAAKNLIGLGEVDETASGAYTRRRDAERESNQAAERAHPNLYTGTKIAGGLAPVLATGGSIGALGAAGALAGLGGSDADLTTGDASSALQAGQDMALGGAAGLVGGTVASKMGPAAINAAKGAPAATKSAIKFITDLRAKYPNVPVETIMKALGLSPVVISSIRGLFKD